MPSIAAMPSRRCSSAWESARSLPYEVVFSETRLSSLTPSAASQAASARISSGVRETNEPRKDGMAQKVQRRSQPEASLRFATGPSVRRLRTTARCCGAPAAIAAPSACALREWPGTTAAALWRAAGASGRSLRRSEGWWDSTERPARMSSRRAAMSG